MRGLDRRSKIALIICLLAIGALSTSYQHLPGVPYSYFLICVIGILVSWGYVAVSASSRVWPIVALLLFCGLLRALYIAPDPILIGYDAYNEFIVLEQVIEQGRWAPSRNSPYIAFYPSLYVFSAFVAAIFDWGVMTTAKFSSFLYVFLPGVFMFLLARNRTNWRVGLLIWLPFATLYTHIFLHSNIHREAFALPLFLLLIFVYDRFQGDERTKRRLFALTVPVLAVLVLTHHMTSAVTVLFLSLVAIFYDSDLLPGRDRQFGNPYLIPALLAGIFLLTFWTSIERSPLLLLTQLILSTIGPVPSAVPTSEVSVISAGSARIQLLLWAEIALGLLIGVLGALGLVYGRKDALDVSLFVFAGIAGVAMVAIILGAVFPGEGLGLATRFKPLVFIGALPLSAYVLAKLLSRPQKGLTVLAVVLVMTFAFLSVYRIPPYLITGEYDGGPRAVISESDAAAVEFLGTGPLQMTVSNPIVPKLNGYSKLVRHRGIGYGPPYAQYNVSRVTPADASECLIFQSGPVDVTMDC